MSPLPNGRYHIRSVSGEKLVGRHLVEDRSLNPKRIILLPDNIEHQVFEFKAQGSETEISTRGAHTANIDGLLFAVLLEEPLAEKWNIEAVPQHGKSIYIIKTADGEKGWVLPENEPETQLVVRPLVATKSIPPQYLPNELWEIVPA